jgi:hypothetical protein
MGRQRAALQFGQGPRYSQTNAKTRRSAVIQG